ncbi:MAG: hypothetical protein E6R13_09045, partial [Spirochaetes bacterium]
MAYWDGNKDFNNALPRQQIPLRDKLKNQDKFGVSEWGKDTMDALESIARYAYRNNLRLLDNYNILQGRFDLKHYLNQNDYYDLTSAIAQEMDLPYKLQHYDITTKAVELLLGEFLKRPDLFRVLADDPESTNEKVRTKTELVQSFLQTSISNEIKAKLIKMGLDPDRNEFKNEKEQAEYQAVIEQKYKELTPDSIEKYMRYDYRTAAEHWGEGVLKMVYKNPRFYFKEQEKEEFVHMLAADRCFTHFRLSPEGFRLDVWNPVEVFFDDNPSVRHVEDGSYVGRVYYMSKARVIDVFGWKMSKEQQEALYPEYTGDYNKDKNGVYGEFFHAELMPHVAYRDFATVANALGTFMGSFPVNISDLSPLTAADGDYFGDGYYYFRQADMVQITEAYWRSQRQIGELNLINPDTGELEVLTVDETFDPELFGVEEVKSSIKDYKENPKPNTICWSWVSQIWQGVKINMNNYKSNDGKRTGLYLDVRPCDFQFKGDYNPYTTPKLPVCGQVFNNTNGRSMSLVDKLKPYQIFFNAVYNQAYGVAQRNNGKFLLMDASVLPRLKDWGGEESYEKFMAIANSIGLGVIDSRRENVQGSLLAQSNGFREVNLDRTEEITRLLNMAILIEQQGMLQVGITPQRQGQIQASETATGTLQAQEKSYAITEVYFENYSNFKRRKLNMLLDLAQFVQTTKGNDITLDFISSDLSNSFLQATGTEILLKDLNVIIEDGRDTAEQLRMAQTLILQNNTTNIPMSKLIGMLRYKSLADMEKALEQSEEDFNKQQEAIRQHESEMQQQALQAQAADKQADRDLKKYEIDTKAATELQKTTLQGIANESSYDPNADLTDKLIAQKDLALKEQQLSSQNAFQQMQLTNQILDGFNKKKLEETKLKSQEKLKKDEAKAKQSIENQKLEQIKEQSRNQEKLQTEKIKADLKLLEEKKKQEQEKAKSAKELKELDKQMKLLDLEIAKKQAELEEKAKKTEIALEKQMGEAKADAVMKQAEAKAK